MAVEVNRRLPVRKLGSEAKETKWRLQRLVNLSDHCQLFGKGLRGFGGPTALIVQELCESRGGRPGLSVLTSLLVSVDVKNY